MLCSVCQKNEAVICYTEVINGVKNEKYLCKECAAKYTGFGSDFQSFSPGNLLAGLLASVLGQAGLAASHDEGDEKKTNLVCHTCGMTYNEFLKYSKFGCADCVHTFGFLMDDYLKKIQGSYEHVGKDYSQGETVSVPEIVLMTDRKADVQADSLDVEAVHDDIHSEMDVQNTDGAHKQAEMTELEILTEQLQEAIDVEAYEEAARLRDAIRALKAKEAASHGNVV